MNTPLPELPLAHGVRVLKAEPNGLIALEKPSGVRAHPNDNKPDSNALLTVVYDAEEECYQWSTASDGRTHRLWLLHRLDAPTSGLILCSTNEELAIAVKAAFAERKVEKVYHAIIRGSMPGYKTVWKDRFSITRKQGLVRAGCGGAVEASVAVKAIKAVSQPRPLTLLELRPHTGRTHQLRVQCAEHDHPIVGDATYGDFRLNREIAKQTGHKRLFLHSSSLSFTLGRPNGVSFAAQSLLPEAFGELVDLP